MNKDERTEMFKEWSELLSGLAGSIARVLVDESDYPSMLSAGNRCMEDPMKRYVVVLCTRDSADRLQQWVDEEQISITSASKQAGLNHISYRQDGDYER